MRNWPEWTSPDGRIRLINADCLRLLPLLEADSVVTDPPYGIARDNHGGMLETRGMVANDESQEVGQKVLDWCERIKVPTAAFASPRKPWAGTWRNLIVWDKGGAVAGGGDLRTCLKLSWELIQVARNGSIAGGRDDSVWRHAVTQQDFENHPTEKPVGLIQRLLRTLFDDAETILDPFAGSCTTAIACIRTDRRCICIEKEAKYWQIGIDRCKREYARTVLLNDQEAVA
jgi:DNA modification methylase